MIAALFGGALFVELCIATLGSGLQAIGTDGAALEPGFGSPAQIGELLLTRFLLPFEIASFLLLIAAVGAVVLARRRGGITAAEDQARYSAMDMLRPAYTGTMAEAVGHRGQGTPLIVASSPTTPATRPTIADVAEPQPDPDERLMAIGWYLAVSAMIFSIGAAGVLTRRSPLVILLCIELMLNAANLALIAFARMHGDADGQIFAVIVMVVAACEVTVGLGLIVAMHRRRLPIDVDEMRELQG